MLSWSIALSAIDQGTLGAERGKELLPGVLGECAPPGTYLDLVFLASEVLKE